VESVSERQTAGNAGAASDLGIRDFFLLNDSDAPAITASSCSG
jgi:hypothetical protein